MDKKVNKKIKNATVCSKGNITFKSIFERTCFTLLEKEGFNPEYEPKKFTLLESFVPVVPFYDRETAVQYNKRIKESGKKDTKELRLQDKRILPITYTPDIYIKYKNVDVWIECKGYTNDVYPYKRKMFRKTLDNMYLKTGQKSIYFEIYTKKQLTQAINIIKSYGQEGQG